MLLMFTKYFKCTTMKYKNIKKGNCDGENFAYYNGNPAVVGSVGFAIIEYTKTHNRLYRFRIYYKFFSNIDDNTLAAKIAILYVGYVFKYHELISSIKFDWLDEDVYKSIYI